MAYSRTSVFVFHADGLFLGVFCFVIFGGCKGLCFAWLTAGPVCLCFMLVGFFGACFVLCFLEAARGSARMVYSRTSVFVFHAGGLFWGVFCFVLFGGCEGPCFA